MSEALKKAFEKNAYNVQQKEELRLADRQHLNLEKMLDPRFDWEQMREIRLSLKEGVDPTPFAKPSIPSEEMEHIRETLFDREAVYQRLHEEAAERRLRRFIRTAALVAISVSVAAVVLWKREFIAQAIMDMKFSLSSTDEKIGISKLGELNLMNYVSRHDQKGIVTYTPTETDIKRVGTYDIKFTLTNDAKSSSRYMRLRVVDDVSPVLALRTSSDVIEQGKVFDARSYIAEASDNVDSGSLAEKVKIDGSVDTSRPGNYTVKYELKDSSGNASSQSLFIEVKKHEEKKTSKDKTTSKKKATSGSSKKQAENTTSAKKKSSAKKTSSKKKISKKKTVQKKTTARRATASSRTFSFSSSSNMTATYQKALAYAQSQMASGRANSYSVTPVRGSDGTYTGYRVTFR